MKQTLLAVSMLYMLSSCHLRHTDASQSSPTLDTAAFFASFRQMNFDTMSIICNFDSTEREHTFFHGVAIDTLAHGLFPDTVIHSYGPYFSFQELFALGRFDLDDTYQAYLYRSPIEGYGIAVDMLIYDRKNKKFLNKILRVANSWGDAGEETLITSLLHRRGRVLEIDRTLNEQWQIPADSLVETFVHTATEDIYRVQNGIISQISSREFSRDTVHFGMTDTAVAHSTDTSAGVPQE